MRHFRFGFVGNALAANPAPRHPLRIRARARARMEYVRAPARGWMCLPYFRLVGTRSLRRSYSFPDRGFTNGNRRGNHAPWHIRNWTGGRARRRRLRNRGRDRTSVGEGKGVAVRLELGGGRNIKKKKK